MKNFRREYERIVGQDIAIASWWGTREKTWHAFPRNTSAWRMIGMA